MLRDAGGGRLPHETKDVRAEKMYAAANPNVE